MRPHSPGPAQAAPALQEKAAQDCIQKSLMSKAPGVCVQEREQRSRHSAVVPALPLARGMRVLGWGGGGALAPGSSYV